MIYTKEQTDNFRNEAFAFLLVEEKDHVLHISLNRPDKRNAFHQPLANELAFALAYAHYNKDIWVVKLSAQGPVFCAGADLKAFAGMQAEEHGSTIPMPKDLFVLGDEFRGLHKPCIAAVHGDVYAGGFLMICGCTHVVAVEEAKFGLPEVRRGIWPMQVMASLMPIMKPRDMLDMCMRARVLSAREAFELGIITSLVRSGELEHEVSRLIDSICMQSPAAIRLGLQAYDEMRNVPEKDMHKYLHGMLMKVLQTKDAQEGLAAFREKRDPQWTGE